MIDENCFAFAPCLLHDRGGKLPWLHHRGDNFASTLREPAEPTIDSEDFDERLQAAVDQRQVGTSQRFQPFSPGGKPRLIQGFLGGQATTNHTRVGFGKCQVVPRIILGQEVEGNEGGIGFPVGNRMKPQQQCKDDSFVQKTDSFFVLSRRRLTTGKSFMSFLD